MKIIPAIDVIDGKCVRLTEGDYNTAKIYNANPLDMAKMFEDNGLHYLHLVDLDGAKNGNITNWKVLEQISTKTNLHVDFGGGLKTDKDLEIAFNCGAKQITGGSIAVKNPTLFEEWIKRYGNKIILGADVKNNMVAISGWMENTNITLTELISKYITLGIQDVICTDISKDGKLQGPGIELYKSILKEHKTIQLIASGGIHNIGDLEECATIGCTGAIVGKAIYEGKISLKELYTFTTHVS